MCANWQHNTIITCAANEHAQFCGVARSIRVEYGIDVLFPRYKPGGVSQYPSQSVSLVAQSHLSGLMVKPFLGSQCKMVANSLTWWLQSVKKEPTSLYIWIHNILWIQVIWTLIMWIHVIQIHIYHMTLYIWIRFVWIIIHNCLSNVWRAFESHRESQVLVFTKWCDDAQVVLTFVVMLKCIVLHTNVKFSKNLLPRMLAQNVHDYRERILLTSYVFVQLTWVDDPAYSVVLFLSLQIDLRHWVRRRMHRLGIWINVNVYLYMWIYFKSFIKHLFVLL